MTEWILKRFVKDYKNTEDPKVRASYGKVSGIVGIVCNVVLCTLKLFIGFISSSVSIMADAVNNFTDASSSIISLLGFKLAEKPADSDHPYGHGRYEYLSAMMIAVLILVIGVELLKSSIDKILHPADVAFGIPLVVVLCFSILLKLWMMFFNHRTGKKINSQALLATSADSRNDVITTAAVLLAAIISHFSGFELDGWIGVAVAVFILISGIGLIKDTINPMLGTAPDEESIQKIRDRIMSYPGVLGMHDLMVHDYGPCRKFASVHVEMAAEEDVLVSHDMIDNIEKDFLADGLNLIIHYDPILTKDSITHDIRKQVDTAVKSIDSALSIHDLRVVPGSSHTNLVFDCVSPHSVTLSDKELKAEICKKVKEIDGKYNCVITVDKSYAPIPH